MEAGNGIQSETRRHAAIGPNGQLTRKGSIGKFIRQKLQGHMLVQLEVFSFIQDALVRDVLADQGRLLSGGHVALVSRTSSSFSSLAVLPKILGSR